MLTCSLAIPVTGVSCDMRIDGAHYFSISALGTPSDLPPLGTEVTIYRSGVRYMRGIVTAARAASGGALSISGQDLSSHYAEHATLQDVQLDEHTATTLAAASAAISSAISCPALPCYGFGSYSGTVAAYVERICNSFGLHYVYNPVAVGITVSATVVEPSESQTVVPTLSYTSELAESTSISSVYLQKTVVVEEAEETTIKNGSHTWTTTAPISNSISPSSGSAYPSTVHIDPGTWQQVQLYSNSTFVEYTEKVDLAGFKRVCIDSWSDTTATPRWELYLYQGDSTLLAHWHATGEAQAWESNGDEVATKAVIARVDPDTHAIDYPDSDGVSCTIRGWRERPSGVPSWEKEFESGDDGHPDTNAIDEPMYPALSALDGVRVAKRDSNPYTNEINCPGIVEVVVSLPEVTYTNIEAEDEDEDAEFPAVLVPLVAVSYSTQGNTETTRLRGEY